MKMESPAFTLQDLRNVFSAELAVIDRQSVIDRLRSASARLRAIAASVPEQPLTNAGDWNAKEVLAHIAVASKGWGTIAYLVANGRITELVGEQVITQRDPLGMAMMKLSVGEITNEATHAHDRTLAYLERSPIEAWIKEFVWELGRGVAADLFRLPITAHLEQHVGQLEAALGSAALSPAVSA